MAFPFHVACPITCKRICYCSLGFPPTLQNGHGRNAFRNDIEFVDRFLRDPWLFRVCEGSTVQVPVPKVSPPVLNGVAGGDSAVALRKGVNVPIEFEDFTRRFDFGSSLDAPKDSVAKDQCQDNANVMCRLCFTTASEGSERARRMLPCRDCGNKYHINCLKTWSQHRDLFHWSSWSCPSCRTCEVCRRTGEPNKFKFCKRCDGAIHCYCMQPPHKNVSSGPYLCSKHTKCHSCDSNVPGNGSSLRWFLGYTCCDACGRLFTKGNYCPVCLKVYRDSEATPMVCCDVCQHWVHCNCDGISDERYMQFQVDRNLPYTCPTCRGEFYQIRDLQDAVRELWRRKDEADQDLIARLRATAGLPTQEEYYAISPFSDDDDDIDGSSLRSELRRKKYTSVKSVPDLSSINNTKEYVKKSSSQMHVKNKGQQLSPTTDCTIVANGEDYHDTPVDTAHPYQANLVSPTKITRSSSPRVKICSVNGSEETCMNEIAVNSEERKLSVIHSNSNVGDIGTKTKGTKFVIHLGGRNKTVVDSLKCDSSSDKRKQDFMLNGDRSHETNGLKPSECTTLKFGVGEPKESGINAESDKGTGLSGPKSNTPRISLRRSNGCFATTTGLQKNVSKVEIMPLQKGSEHNPNKSGDDLIKSSKQASLLSDNLTKESRPLLRIKVKTPCSSSWLLEGEKERGVPKGQRSKRKRPSFVEKFKQQVQHDKDLMGEITDASWVLKKLGREAIGKRVEVHQSSDNSWHKGIISDVIEETSMLFVGLDDGRTKTCELGKQGIRLVPQIDKRPKI